jgi:hypothetical protein
LREIDKLTHIMKKPATLLVVGVTAPAQSVHVKALADQLFALLPKCLCALRIEGVSLHTPT